MRSSSPTKGMLPAKLARPETAQALSRERLYQRLDAERTGRILWITGPPGSGKTVLVSSYLSERQLPALWYQVDEGDADPAAFFHYVNIAARGRMAPNSTALLPALTPEYRMGLLTFARRYFETLWPVLETPPLLVLDNYQEIPDAALLHEILAHAVPVDGSILILSRAEPPPAFARLRLYHQLTVIGYDELRLTLDEAQALTRLLGEDRALSPADLQRWHDRLHGWAAGYTLSFNQVGQGTQGADPVPASVREVLFDYFAGEVLDRLPEATRHVLLITALLPQMTAAMAVQLSGDAGAASLLADLHRRNYFLLRREQAEPVYEYHPLFRAFLGARAEALFDADTLARLRAQAGRLLEAAGQEEAAALLYREAGDFAALAALALGEARNLIASGRHETLIQWFAALPDAYLESSPWLSFWRGMAHLPFDPRVARLHLEQAYAGFEAQDDPTGLYLTWAGLMDTFNVEWHDYKPMDRWIAAFERLQACHPKLPSPEIELRVYAMLVAITYRAPQHPKLPVWAEHALQLLHCSSDPVPGVQLGAHLLHHHAWRGDLLQGQAVMEALKRLPHGSPLTPFVQCLSYALGAVYSWVKGEPQDCQKQVDLGLELAQETGMHAWDTLLLAQGVYAKLVAGDITGAEGWLRSLAARTRMDAYLEAGHYHFLAALVAQQKGEFAQGLKQAEQALAMTMDAGSPFPQALSHLSIGFSALQLGEDAEAEKHICVARAIGQEMGNGFIEYLSSLIEARTLIERGQEPRGLEKLAVTVRHGREGGRYAVHWWGPANMAQLYAKALDAGIEVEYVQEVIRRTQLTPPDLAAAPDDWPWPIRIYTLGRFSVVKDGTVLRFAGKAQKKPLELLQYLIALGGREAPEGRVADQLWPDAEGDAAYRSLIVTLHRLRQWLGCSDAVELTGGQLSLNQRLVWVDIWAFERLVSRLGEAGKNGLDAIGSASTKKKAQALYRGSFLESSDHPWVLARREQLRSKFIRCVLARGQALESEGRWSDAIACYQCGIEVEPFVEPFHRQLIECYRRAGNIAESEVAAEHWERLRALPGVPTLRGR